jgi:hypothetical protein
VYHALPGAGFSLNVTFWTPIAWAWQGISGSMMHQ